MRDNGFSSGGGDAELVERRVHRYQFVDFKILSFGVADLRLQDAVFDLVTAVA